MVMRLSIANLDTSRFDVGDFMYGIQDISVRPKGYRFAYSSKL